MVAGLGTITPASGFVGPIGALAIGVTAGIVCFYATHYFKRTLKIDDSLDVFPVHGVGGVTGSLLTGVFATSSLGGLGLAEGVSIMDQVGVQALAIMVTLLWSAGFSYLILKVLDKLIGLRVTADEEVQGLDIVLHEETGYQDL
jgi:ammonium transporter, Amt family